MSRMQTILDKAERDGAVLRLRPLAADQAVYDAPQSVAPVTGAATFATATSARSRRPGFAERIGVCAGAVPAA